jgi:large subunit ribosomal protein L35
MPKLKTHSGTKKRVKTTKTGRLQRRHSSSNHFLQKKSASRKREFAGVVEIVGKNKKNLKKKLGI